MTCKNVTHVSDIDIDTKRTIDTVIITPSYTSGKQYRCMFCTLAVSGNPLGCPTEVVSKRTSLGKHSDEEISRTDEDGKITHQFMVYGVFCSYNCVQAFINKNSHDSRFSNSNRYLLMLRSLNENGTLVNLNPITPSPEPELMMCYGGVLTEAQYQSLIGKALYVNRGFTVINPQSTIYTKTDIM